MTTGASRGARHSSGFTDHQLGATVSELRDAALDYAERGWPVLPCQPRGKIPLTRHGVHDATCDPNVIAGWWTARPMANVALACGVCFDCLDVDSPEGLANLADAAGPHQLGWGPISRTGRGWHYLIAPGRKNRAGLLDGVDLRGAGGFIIAPPSIHPSGRRYRWTVGADTPIVPAPAWLASLLDPPPRPVRSSRRPQLLLVGSRLDRYGRAALQGEAHCVAIAPEGTRNHTLNRSAFRVGQLIAAGYLTELDAEEALLFAALFAGLDEDEARATIRSGLAAGMAKPR